MNSKSLISFAESIDLLWKQEIRRNESLSKFYRENFEEEEDSIKLSKGKDIIIKGNSINNKLLENIKEFKKEIENRKLYSEKYEMKHETKNDEIKNEIKNEKNNEMKHETKNDEIKNEIKNEKNNEIKNHRNNENSLIYTKKIARTTSSKLNDFPVYVGLPSLSSLQNISALLIAFGIGMVVSRLFPKDNL